MRKLMLCLMAASLSLLSVFSDLNQNNLGFASSNTQYESELQEVVNSSDDNYYGQPLKNKDNLDEFKGRNDIDLLARMIFAEAGGEPLNGKIALTFIVKNRIHQGKAEFCSNKKNISYSDVILCWTKDSAGPEFQGMELKRAREPKSYKNDKKSWEESLAVAKLALKGPRVDNLIGKSLWFNTMEVFQSKTKIYDGFQYYKFPGTKRYVRVKGAYYNPKIWGKHIFFFVEGY